MRRALGALAVGALLLAGCTGETDDDVVDAVPANVRAYVHLDRASDDWDRAAEALEKMPALEGALFDLLAGVPRPPGDGEAGLMAAANAGPVVVEPSTPPVPRALENAVLYGDLLEALPNERFVHGYLTRAALGPLRPLDRSVVALGAGADIEDDLLHLRVRASNDRPPGACASGRGDSELLDLADPDAALYVELPSIACAVRALADRAEGGRAALARFERAARRHGGVSLDDELMPLLDNRGALIATPGDAAPTITLLVDDVDEEGALDLLARLQPAFTHLLNAEALGQAPTFGSADVGGITVATAQLAPGLELSYAAWDGRLAVSTSLEGIAQLRRAEGLPGSDDFDRVLGDRPSKPTALLFLDLDQLLALGEQAGLAEDPRYLAVRDDLQKLRAAGAVVSREEKSTTAELTFQIP